jgi:hypothetical protein
MTDQTLLKLRELLLNEFSESELISLCQDIGLDYQALPGTGTFGKTREIIEVARAQDKLRVLQSRLRELKPAAYAAAGISSLDPADQLPAAAEGAPAPQRRAGPWPAIPRTVALLLSLLVLVACAALLLPRLISGPAAQATPASSAASTLPAADQSTSMPIAEAATALPATPPADEATSAAGQGDAVAPIMTTAAQPTEALTDQAVSTEAPAPAQAEVLTPEPAPAGTLSPAEAHPAAQNVRGLNELLLSFYTGKITAKDLEDYWTGDALRLVTGFGDVRLPRAMRISPTQREALDISYEYLRPPTLVSETADGAIVTSREFWRYANTLNRAQICEVRDYEYRLVREGDRYRVRSFQSRLLETRCRS